MPWTRKTTFASSLAPMTTVGPSSLTLFLFMPPTWADQEATSLTPSAVDSVFNTYIAGVTNSTNFPTKGTTVIQSGNKGNGDCFIAEINPAGNQLLYSTYLGGSQSDAATAHGREFRSCLHHRLHCFCGLPRQGAGGRWHSGTLPTNLRRQYRRIRRRDRGERQRLGILLVFGWQWRRLRPGYRRRFLRQCLCHRLNPINKLPVSTQCPRNPISTGSQDAFVTKVNFTGEQILYSTYLGGSAADVGQSLRVG